MDKLLETLRFKLALLTGRWVSDEDLPLLLAAVVEFDRRRSGVDSPVSAS